MDCVKIGNLIAKLRKEKKLTQRNIADALGIQNKTVSKWECGLGCPDLSLWPEQSPTCRFPITTGGKLFVYCIKHGLSVYSGNL